MLLYEELSPLKSSHCSVVHHLTLPSMASSADGSKFYDFDVLLCLGGCLGPCSATCLPIQA